MREVKQVTWYYVDMQWLSNITIEVYGREYDIQMGERNNGEYDVVNTDPDYQWNEWPGEYEFGGEWKYLETPAEAIDFWLKTDPPQKSWERPSWQPEVWAVLSDLANRGEIPHGKYFISIDW